jgi:GDPmannose 4,6-dehydratase
MLNQEQPKEYILSSGETHTVREFVEKSFIAAGINNFYWDGKNENERLLLSNFLLEEGAIKSNILVKINPVFYRPAEVDLLLGNSVKAEKELNWSPEISFENLIKEMIENDYKM